MLLHHGRENISAKVENLRDHVVVHDITRYTACDKEEEILLIYDKSPYT